MVWELLDSTEKASVSAGRVGIYEVLAGCTDAVAWEEGQGGDGDRNSGVLVKINLAVASRIAGKSFPYYIRSIGNTKHDLRYVT